MLSIEYMAGLVDGEGCIAISKKIEKRVGRSSSYTTILQIAMTNERVIKAVKDSFGGSYSTIKWHTRNNNRPAYMWRVCAYNAAELLGKLLPYLIVKKDEAAFAIAFQNHMKETKSQMCHKTEEQKRDILAYREQAHKTLQAMKRVSGALDGMIANSVDTPLREEGQYRAKQPEDGIPVGVCNEQVLSPKGKMCSELGSNVENAAEMTASAKH